MTESIDIAKSWFDAMNSHDLEMMSSLYAKDVVGDEIADPPVRDRKGVEKSYRELFYSYPDCKAKVLNIFSSADQVLAEIRWTGTNTREFRGAPATNAVTDLRIAYIFKIVEGKIKKITEYYDSASV